MNRAPALRQRRCRFRWLTHPDAPPPTPQGLARCLEWWLAGRGLEADDLAAAEPGISWICDGGLNQELLPPKPPKSPGNSTAQEVDPARPFLAGGPVRCEDCAGGQLAGQPLDAVREQIPKVTLPQPAATAGAADSLSRDRRACPRVSYAGGLACPSAGQWHGPPGSTSMPERASRLCSFTAIVMVTVCKAAPRQLRTVRRGSSTTSDLTLSGGSPGRRATGNYVGASGAFTLLGGSATGNNVGGHNASRDAGGQP